MEKQEWQTTKYYEEHPQKCPFSDGEYYHVGFLNQFSDTFVYQGVFQWNSNFWDGVSKLKPFPTHYIHIPKPIMLK